VRRKLSDTTVAAALPDRLALIGDGGGV